MIHILIYIIFFLHNFVKSAPKIHILQTPIFKNSPKFLFLHNIVMFHENNVDVPKTDYTPLNILNGTPTGVPLDVSRATLPINQLKSADIKDVRSNSNVHRCKNVFLVDFSPNIPIDNIPNLCKILSGQKVPGKLRVYYFENMNQTYFLHP